MKNSYRICLLDDHQFIIDGIKRMISSEKDLEVVAEYTKPELFQKDFEAEKLNIDLLISDLSMPELSGLSLIKYIKSITPELKVLALTMHEEASYMKEIYQMGGEGYLLKSSAKGEFIMAINRIRKGGRYYTGEMVHSLLDYKNEHDAIDQIIESLSPRELDVIHGIVAEKTSQEIADELFISLQTVNTHRKNILQKLGVKTVVGITKFALENNL